MFLIPSQSLYLLHESLCSMPNPLELLKSQLTACIEQPLRLLAVKTFFCAALQLFSGGTHHFFQAELIAVYCFGQLQPVYKNNALLWSFDGKFYNVIIELSVRFNFSMHKYTFILIEREKWQKPFQVKTTIQSQVHI